MVDFLPRPDHIFASKLNKPCLSFPIYFQGGIHVPMVDFLPRPDHIFASKLNKSCISFPIYFQGGIHVPMVDFSPRPDHIWVIDRCEVARVRALQPVHYRKCPIFVSSTDVKWRGSASCNQYITERRHSRPHGRLFTSS